MRCDEAYLIYAKREECKPRAIGVVKVLETGTASHRSDV